MAIRVIDVMKRRGLEGGRDVAVTGFDVLPLPYDTDPPLTTVQLPIEKATEKVARLLLRRIEGEAVPTAGSIVAAQLVVGGTT